MHTAATSGITELSIEAAVAAVSTKKVKQRACFLSIDAIKGNLKRARGGADCVIKIFFYLLVKCTLKVFLINFNSLSEKKAIYREK